MRSEGESEARTCQRFLALPFGWTMGPSPNRRMEEEEQEAGGGCRWLWLWPCWVVLTLPDSWRVFPCKNEQQNGDWRRLYAALRNSAQGCVRSLTKPGQQEGWVLGGHTWVRRLVNAVQCLPNCLIVRITGGQLVKNKYSQAPPQTFWVRVMEEGLGMPVYMPQVILVIRQVQPMLWKCCCALHNNAQWQEDHPHEQMLALPLALSSGSGEKWIWV